MTSCTERFVVIFKRKYPCVTNSNRSYIFFINTLMFDTVACRGLVIMGGGTFFKVGGNKCTSKNFRKCLWFQLETVTSQVLKYDFITYIPYEGINYAILNKITPLWKRIGEPAEIQIGCYRDDPGQQCRSGLSCGLFWLNKTVRRLRHWNFHLLSFWLALSLRCDVSYVTINEKFS